MRCAPAVAGALALGLGAAAARAAPAPAPAEKDAQVSALRARLAAHPEDVDTRMELASRLAQLGRRDEARREALEVTRRAPAYADAYELLARIAAWDRDYLGARRWLDTLAAHAPLDTAQQLLRVDTYLWEDQLDLAEAALAEIAAPRDAGVLWRRAQLAYLTRQMGRAHDLAGQLLALDPHDARARGMYDETRRFLAELDTYAGSFPVADPAQRLEAGAVATLVVFPHARWSITAQYELDHRFATDNHRLALRIDWRPLQAWTFTMFARSGWVEVVPQTTAYARVGWEPRTGDYLDLSYQVDLMTWPGQLHRAIADAGVWLGHHFRLDVGGSLGRLDYCGEWHTVTGYEASLGYVRRRWQVALKYAHGTELDRPVLSAFLQGMYGANACPADLGSNAAMLDLESIQTDDIAVLPTVQLGPRTAVGASYTYERRFNGSVVNTGGLSLRRSF